MFVHDLFIRIVELENIPVPHLNGFPVSHLLWADDLILLALDNQSLEAQLDCLHEFASKFELSINVQKTNIMVFNSSTINDAEAHRQPGETCSDVHVPNLAPCNRNYEGDY